MPPLHIEIEAYILEKINSGMWRVGDQIPKEADLCEQFQVSRPTVRVALQRLVHKGLLVRIKGKGTFVTQPKTLENSTIFIESFAEEMKSMGVKIKTELLEFRLVAVSEFVASKVHRSPGTRMVKITRLRYAENAFETGPIVLTTSYFIEEIWSFVQKYDLEQCSLRKALSEHHIERKFIEKIIDIRLLEGKERRLLGSEHHAPAFLISSVTKDQNGRIIEYCESIYPADRNRFTLTLRT